MRVSNFISLLVRYYLDLPIETEAIMGDRANIMCQ